MVSRRWKLQGRITSPFSVTLRAVSIDCRVVAGLGHWLDTKRISAVPSGASAVSGFARIPSPEALALAPLINPLRENHALLHTSDSAPRWSRPPSPERSARGHFAAVRGSFMSHRCSTPGFGVWRTVRPHRAEPDQPTAGHFSRAGLNAADRRVRSAWSNRILSAVARRQQAVAVRRTETTRELPESAQRLGDVQPRVPLTPVG